ncbi:MAG: N-acetylmuramoyl-L-alanine amidase [Litoreibacter sp.]
MGSKPLSHGENELGLGLQPLWHPSPNFGPRKQDAKPDLVVIHYTAMADANAALDVLCDETCEVSAHYLIAKDGTVYQLVEETERAWHAGAGQWRDIADVNSRSIGIELCNDGYSPFSHSLMNSLETLLSGIVSRWAIPPAGVIGHSDLAPGRKIDPGRKFDWLRLADQGLAIQASAQAPCPAGAFRKLAIKAGYTADVPDTTLLEAFRLRHRPWGIGPLCEDDLCIMSGLIHALGLAPEDTNA